MNSEKNFNNQASVTPQKGERLGLWIGLGAAAITALGVVGLAIYTDHKENTQQTASTSVAQTHTEAPSIIPTSESQAASIAVATSNTQSQGMTAPSDVGDEQAENTITEVQMTAPVSTETPIVASAVAASAVSEPIVAAVSSPAQVILAAESQTESKVVAENGMVKFYFATGKADVTANTLESLKEIVEGVKAGQKAVILTYSNVESNERLARDRALAVRSVLLAAGIPDGSIEVSNPTAESSDSRRVDVVLR